MEILKLELNEKESFLKIENNPEDPYISFSSSGSGYNTVSSNNTLIAEVVFKFHHAKHGIIEESIIFSNQDSLNTKNGISSITPISDPNIELVEIHLSEKSTLKDFHISIVVQKGRNRINVESPIKLFHDFIQNRANSKILFSGGFGQGKTTFLNFYFNEAYEKSYNVFRVFPVNYSVASNEDIFKYIKADILFQLLGFDIEFDKSSIDIKQAFQEYVYLNPKKTIFSFLRNVSKINAQTEMLDKSIKAFNKFMEPIINYHESQQSDDEEAAKTYIKSIYDQEGSLFEDNFYSQLIRQLLERTKERNNIPNVLIIEDLDRMDPDHIFRILNVISAHYDTYKYNGNETHNKFGIDKIILVCDIENIRSIFHHRYGVNTNFEGYINKYYSTRPYVFENLSSVKGYLDEILESYDKKRFKDPRIFAHSVLLRLLLEGEELSLREMLKLLLNDFESFRITNTTSSPFENGQFYKSLRFLKNLYTSRELSLKFERLKSKNFKTSIDFQKQSAHLLAGLGTWATNGKNITTNYSGNSYEIDCDLNIHYDIIINPEINQRNHAMMPGNPRITNFSKKHFCDLVIEHLDVLT
ncbi:P-loop NTPase fold protein [Fluviicola taffensis]|nr:P-loop NTPase fold protein [Fluviicola taffensis]